jgi:hypothetical protein
MPPVLADNTPAVSKQDEHGWGMTPSMGLRRSMRLCWKRRRDEAEEQMHRCAAQFIVWRSLLPYDCYRFEAFQPLLWDRLYSTSDGRWFE